MVRYPDNSPPGQFAPDNSPPIFKQLALCSFIRYRAKQDVQCMEPRLNAIEIILRSLIHYQTNNSSFFYPLPSLKFGGELSRGRVVWHSKDHFRDLHFSYTSELILWFHYLCSQSYAAQHSYDSKEWLRRRLTITLLWTCISSRGEYSKSLHATETGICSGLMGHLAGM